MTLIALNKPYGALCQFTDAAGRTTLADYVDVAGVYPAGRLDHDSEGLVLLTDDGQLQARISHPGSGIWKRYLAQVERIPDAAALSALREGVLIEGRRTRPAKIRLVDMPEWLWQREPPIRFRRNVPTAWLQLEIHEGRNRQVRRMTAAVGHPTLRLVRVAIGTISVQGFAPGEWRRLAVRQTAELAARASRPRPFRRRQGPES